jgi:hypothetical protein
LKRWIRSRLAAFVVRDRRVGIRVVTFEACIAFHLTGGEASDSRNFETLLDIGPDLNPRAALGDKGYDSKSNRDTARQRGICPAIPYRSNTKDMPAFFPKTLYKARARIEQAVGKE